jgi:hypothetical protein
MSSAPYCATFPRHLGRLITRCLLAQPNGADTVQLAEWAYGSLIPVYGLNNVRRHCRMWEIKPIGRRNRRLVWALRKLDD